MPREAQAMMVTLFVAAHINKHGSPPLEAKLEEYFKLTETILLKSADRERPTAAQARVPDPEAPRG
jgi:hypothetical protein